MPVDRVAVLIPLCVACGRRWWPLEAEHWKAYFTQQTPPELVFYCPECAEGERAED